jgi:hypothetical protein
MESRTSKSINNTVAYLYVVLKLGITIFYGSTKTKTEKKWKERSKDAEICSNCHDAIIGSTLGGSREF